jgi:integrase
MTSAEPVATVSGQEYGADPDPKIPGGAISEGGDVFGRGHVQDWQHAIGGYVAEMHAAGLSAQTIRQRKYQLGILAEDHVRRSPWKLTRADLIAWLGRYDWQPSSQMVYRATLRGFYNWGRLAGHIKRNPADRLPSGSVPSGLPRPVPTEVVEVAAKRADPRARLVLLLGYYAGLRRAEIASLRWESVGVDTLRIVGKGKRTREIPLNGKLAGALGKYESGDDYVFPGNQRGHLAPETIGRIASDALGANWTAHTLRHAFLTRAYQISGDIRTVAALAGHAKLDTSAGYAQLPGDALRRIVDQM